MNNRFLYLIVTLALSALSSIHTDAQIRYMDGSFLINTTTKYYHYGFTAQTNGACFIGTNNRMLQIDITPTGAPRISGHNDQIVFYNSVTAKYNSIQVADVYQKSDENTKTSIRNFNRGLDVIKLLRPVTYNFIDEPNSRSIGNQYTDYNSSIGLLAQELEEILPNLVYTDDEGRKLVNYISLIPVLIDAIQSLESEVESLRSMIE